MKRMGKTAMQFDIQYIILYKVEVIFYLHAIIYSLHDWGFPGYASELLPLEEIIFKHKLL
jgi:hypothetical protein